MSSKTYILVTVHCPLCVRAGETASLEVLFSSQFIRTGEIMIGGRSSGTTLSERKIYCPNCGVLFAKFPESIREKAEDELAKMVLREEEAERQVAMRAEEERRARWRKRLDEAREGR